MCGDPGRLATNSCAGFMTLEAISIASATRIEETGTLLANTVKVPTQLATVAQTVIGRHVASRFSRHLITFNQL